MQAGLTHFQLKVCHYLGCDKGGGGSRRMMTKCDIGGGRGGVNNFDILSDILFEWPPIKVENALLHNLA